MKNKSIYAKKIIKINKDFSVIALFENSEYRKIPFKKLFKKWDMKKEDSDYKLTDFNLFKEVKINGGAFVWNKIKIYYEGENTTYPLDIGSDTLYLESEPYLMNDTAIYLKDMRELKGITQTQLAKKVRVSPTLISNIENKKAPITMQLLSKITSCLV